jgi:tetraacyldisaccharide 4'-kinase
MGALPLLRRANPNKVHWLQNYWYRITPLHLILFPISLAFRVLVALRRAMYRNGMLTSERLLLPVIVVGNISVGGTGKTPLTLAIAKQLIERGWHPLIVSRGFGGKSKHPESVSSSSDAMQVGDEPLLVAQRNICPVWVGKHRVNAAHAALQANPECDVVLCDDGMQHYRLQRDIEIAVVDGLRGFGNKLLLPAGPLREPLSRLQEVDAVVVNGGNAAADQYAMRLSGDSFYNLLEPDNKVSASYFHGKKNHVVAGIGNPQRYFQHLEGLGISFISHTFPDHHPYRADDLSFADCDTILMTEKDAVKCASFADARYWVLRVDAQIDPALLELILGKIKSHGSKTA